MLFKDSIVIDAPIDKVWQYIASPDLWSLFNAKIGKCEQISPAGGRIGSVYTMDFRMVTKMGIKMIPARCEITDLQLDKRIEVRSTISDSSQRTASATLTYELEDLGIKTMVNEQVAIAAPKINIFVSAIIWLVSRFGSLVGEKTLKKLKRIVEEG